MIRILSTTIAAVALVASAGLTLAQTTPYPSDRSISNRSNQPTYQDRQGTTQSNRFSRTETAPIGQQGAGNQFASEAEAKSRCGSDTVVWVNTKSHVYHFPGNASFGHTKQGAFMCQADADRAGGLRPAKNEMRGDSTSTGSSMPPRR